MTSDVIVAAGPGAELRDNLVTTAVKFLTNPNVQKCTLESKERFLRSKGLTDPEIQKAIERCADLVDIPSLSSELLFFQQTRRSWFRENVLPLIVYGGCIYGLYWFYKNCIRSVLFVEQPRRKTTVECLDELRKSMDILNSNITALRTDVQNANQQNNPSGVRSQLDNIKSDIASVKGILLNRNQFPSLKSRKEASSIPAWQRQQGGGEEGGAVGAGGGGGAEEAAGGGGGGSRARAHRSQSAGSNSSEGETHAKNSDSSLEIIT